jgi:FkbM family methyltransferase
LKTRARSWLRSRRYDVIRHPAGTEYGGHLVELLTRLRIDCVLDVGAHDGIYGSLLRQLGYTGRIVSFEPVEANFERLRRRAGSDWTVVRLALGSASGEKRITLARDPMLHSFLQPNPYGLEALPDQIPTVGSETVQVARLDEVYDEYVRPGDRVFLKVDTQGYDADVLDGAGDRLADVLALQVELAARAT